MPGGGSPLTSTGGRSRLLNPGDALLDVDALAGTGVCTTGADTELPPEGHPNDRSRKGERDKQKCFFHRIPSALRGRVTVSAVLTVGSSLGVSGMKENPTVRKSLTVATIFPRAPAPRANPKSENPKFYDLSSDR